MKTIKLIDANPKPRNRGHQVRVDEQTLGLLSAIREELSKHLRFSLTLTQTVGWLAGHSRFTIDWLAKTNQLDFSAIEKAHSQIAARMTPNDVVPKYDHERLVREIEFMASKTGGPNKIDMIKLVRDRTQATLLDSKNWVEALLYKMEKGIPYTYSDMAILNPKP
jgi:ribosomal protein L7/L12